MSSVEPKLCLGAPSTTALAPTPDTAMATPIKLAVIEQVRHRSHHVDLAPPRDIDAPVSRIHVAHGPQPVLERNIPRIKQTWMPLEGRQDVHAMPPLQRV
eukprot:CAMPEP_0114110064 /NCGR_PEP_ID=MMETSP0043_2-20121206/1112_1 /TAXON_ID=464988 /ORGANISM="Hemiselmis andersenii, Strain CCMP644" /LENGTH=99 /DNA_ID=CAMNT_0001201987 /DNA_START=276 /DNA_END=576 /DNA_ORIENTATION=-